MTGRGLDITQRQVRALCKGAKEAGYVPVIRLGNTVVELIPEERAIQLLANEQIDDAEDIRL